jgi:hypothetical protein
VLALTGDKAAGAQTDLAAMVAAGGATSAAFEQMNTGIGPVIDRFNAWKEVMFITIGDALAPIATKLLDLAESILPVVEETIGTITGVIGSFFANLEEGMSPLDAFIEAIWDIAPPEVLDWLVNLRDIVIPGLMAKIEEIIVPIVEWITQYVKLKDVLIVAAGIIGGVVLAAVVGIGIAIAKVVIVVGAMIAAVSLLRNAWENDWGGIRTALTNAWGIMQPIIENLVAWLQVNIPAAIQILTDFWTNTLLPAINAVWAFIQDPLIPLFEVLWELLEVAGGIAITALQGLWENVLLPAIETVWGFINDELVPVFEDLYSLTMSLCQYSKIYLILSRTFLGQS